MSRLNKILTRQILQLTMLTAFFVFSCSKQNEEVFNGIFIEKGELATVSTAIVTNITGTSATIGGNLISPGNNYVSTIGVCWATTLNPTITDNKTENGSKMGEFSSNINELQNGKTFYVRAFAINSFGISYGEQVSFKTLISQPTIFTTLSGVSTTTAIVGCDVISDGGSAVIERGVYWGVNPNPETTGTKLLLGNENDNFTSLLTGLTANTTYYLKAFATNSIGLVYGSQVNFTTTNPITDIEANIYNAVIIGTQTWMQENLKATKYCDGSAIPNITSNTLWSSQAIGAYCWTNNDINGNNTFGALYNYYAVVDNRKLCPTGWHIPTETEWTTLENYLGGSSVAGGKLKATTLWNYPDADNSSGFTGFPGARRDADGTFNYLGSGQGLWWSATQFNLSTAWFRRLSATNTEVFKYYDDKRMGLSVRCLKDN